MWNDIAGDFLTSLKSCMVKAPLFVYTIAIKVDTSTLEDETLEAFEEWALNGLTSFNATCAIKSPKAKTTSQGGKSVKRKITTISFKFKYDEYTPGDGILFNSYCNSLANRCQMEGITIVGIDVATKIASDKKALEELEDEVKVKDPATTEDTADWFEDDDEDCVDFPVDEDEAE